MASAVGAVHRSSDLVKDYCCGACEDKNIEESAEVFCKQCLKLFCGKCIHLHCQLYETHTTYGRGDMSQWPITKKTTDLIYKCVVHNDKKLKMFCPDHCQLCCTNCVLLNHRQCKEVRLISETVQSHLTDLQHLEEEIETTLRELKNVQSKRESSIQTLEGSYNQRLQEIRDVRQKLNAALDDLEMRTIKELAEMRTALQVSLKTDVDVCNSLNNELKQLREAVQDLSDKSKNELSFIAGRKCMDKINESKAYLKEVSHQVELSIVFLANTDIEQYVCKQSGLGRIVQTPNALAVQRNPNHVLTVNTRNEYNVKIQSDSCDQSYIRAICVISRNKIIIADFRAKRMKLLDQKYNVISHCDLPISEGGMCLISESEVAVTVIGTENKHEIQFITESNGQLVTGRRFQVQHECKSIAHHQADLFITSYTAVYKYTLGGQLVKKLYGNKSVYMCAVSPTGDMIYVTTKSENTLLTLNSDGTMISTFTDPELRSPFGVHVTPAGQVLVCGFKSNTVIQVDFEGKKKLTTLATKKDGMNNPVCVCYNTHSDSVIVGLSSNNNILELK